MKGLACAALTLCTLASAASASIFYGVTDGSLVQIDTTAQSVTSIGTLHAGGTNLSVMSDCDFDGSGNLFGIQQGSGSGGFPPPPLNGSYKINTSNASVLQVANYGNTEQLNPLAWSAALGKFYTVSSGDGKLASLDATTGAVTALYANKHGLGGMNKIDALAMAPDGTLYGVWDGGPPLTGIVDDKLIRFDLATGTATVIGSIGTNAQRFWSLRFSETGTLYTVDTFSGTLETVNLTTGAGTVAFSNSALNGVVGLALQVPAPGAAAGMLCLVGLTSTRRRREGRA